MHPNHCGCCEISVAALVPCSFPAFDPAVANLEHWKSFFAPIGTGAVRRGEPSGLETPMGHNEGTQERQRRKNHGKPREKAGFQSEAPWRSIFFMPQIP